MGISDEDITKMLYDSGNSAGDLYKQAGNSIYGRFSGGDTVYNDLKPCGARVFEFTEGSDSFRSWIRLVGGEKIQDLRFPEDFNW